MLKIPQQVIDEGKKFRSKVDDLKNGIIEPERFKPYRVSMGIYEQRENDTYMVRTRIPSGVIYLNQLKKISELAKKYAHGYVHLTTRQDIQFHRVTLEDTANIMEELLEVGIVTKGTGGNTVRNVGCSPLSGVSKDDVFDVTPYALATTEYALNDPTIFNLPRKFKIAFSNSAEDTGNATIADLGFVAKIQNGEKGFEVYGAGGLGGSPMVSIKLDDFIQASDVLVHVQAMKGIFEDEGDRINKNKARIRYILQRLGEDAFKAKYHEAVEKVKRDKSIEPIFVDEIPSKPIGQLIGMGNPLVVEQKVEGYYSIYAHPQNGNLKAENIDEIIHIISTVNYQPSIRLTNTQGFYIRNVRDSHVKEFLNIIQKFTSSFDVDNAVACAGAATCKLGLALSQNLLTAIVDRLSDVDPELKSQLPRIFISGCPNSCGQHQKGEIGLFGKAKRVNDGLVPMYEVTFGGSVGVGKAALGAEYGAIPAKKIPEFILHIGHLRSRSKTTSFMEFIKQEQLNIKKLIDELSVIESEMENPNLYYDFGGDEKFSLRGRGPGECSAGVLDVIKLDISNAQLYIRDFEKSKDSSKLYEASVSASRALLILKGVDTNKDRVIFNEFISSFVETGYVRENINNLVEALIDFKMGDLISLDNYHDDVKYLIGKVKAMYESLNPKLEITLPKEVFTENTEGDLNKVEDAYLELVDLKGVKCPMNFVKAKIALAKVKSNETIGFLIDDGDPIRNVPKSLKEEGHEIIKMDEHYDGYNLLIIKKK